MFKLKNDNGVIIKHLTYNIFKEDYEFYDELIKKFDCLNELISSDNIGQYIQIQIDFFEFENIKLLDKKYRKEFEKIYDYAINENCNYIEFWRN